MNIPSFAPLTIGYATATPAAVASLLADRYGVRADCTLLHRGFNDVYTAGPDLILRIAGRRTRGPADLGTETAFLTHLHAAGVPVAVPVPARDRAAWTVAPMPDGDRSVVLFHRAPGRLPDLQSTDDAAAQARTLAHLHGAAASFAPRGAHPLDLDTLLRRSVERVRALPFTTPALGELVALAARLAHALTRLEPDLQRTMCHGDTHGLNACIGPDGRATFFDFDECGPGYLAYALAVFLWAQVSFGRSCWGQWHAFDAAYRATRPLGPADEAALAPLAAARHIWLMGEYASLAQTHYGLETLPAARLEREVAWLLAWERDQLAAKLV